MPRSGRAWQFNALRLLIKFSGENVYSFGSMTGTVNELGEHRILLIKIHEISPALAGTAWRCFACHRDLRDVAVASADLAQADGYEVDIVPLIQEIRRAHEYWVRQSVLDTPYERMVADPKTVLKRLAACVEIPITEVEAQRLCQTLASLSDGEVPPGSPHHPVTLLHQQHFFDGKPGRHRGALDDALAQQIVEEDRDVDVRVRIRLRRR